MNNAITVAARLAWAVYRRHPWAMAADAALVAALVWWLL